jgi:hypothetical protein
MVAAVLALVATGTPVRADGQADESETYVQRGIEMRRAGQNREALTWFEKARELDPTPRTAAQVALAHQALGDWVEAEQGLESALASAEDPWIARFRSVLEAALAVVRSHLGWLDVQANVEQGELLLDGGATRYPLPLSSRIRVLAKKIDVEVRSQGRVPVERTIEVAPGAQVQVVVALDAPPATGQEPSPVAAQAAVRAPEMSGPATSRGMDTKRLAGYAALGVAVVSAGAGIVAWRIRENEVAVFNSDSQCLMGTMIRGQQCGAHERTANIALGAEIGAFAVAGLGAGLGAWLLWPAATPTRDRTARVACGPWAGYGVTCEGRF